MNPQTINLRCDAFGKLVLAAADGTSATVVPVRAFPIAAPGEGVSLVGEDGHERLWIESLAGLDAASRALIEQELELREFVPVIRRINSVSTFGTPSVWDVQTDRGDTTLVLEGEEDIRRLAPGALLITSGSGVHFRVPDTGLLDRHSRRLLERFL